MVEVEVTAAGIDTWSPGWYVHPEGRCAMWMREHAKIPSKLGARLLTEKINGHAVGWYPSGLVFAEGHPDPDGLCPANELVGRSIELQDAMLAAGMPLPCRERPFVSLGATSEGFAGLRRADSTVNLAMPSGSAGLMTLAGIAAAVRMAPGKPEIRCGPGGVIETVYLRGFSGKNVLGRWYDKALESLLGPRGSILRGEDQRRWPKGDRRDPSELTAEAVRRSFQRRFLPLYQATKGVTVGGPMVIVSKVTELVAAGELGPQQARLLICDTVLEAIGAADGLTKPSTLRRSRQLRRKYGLQLADGVLDEVEVDVGSILEAALETDAWERRG